MLRKEFQLPITRKTFWTDSEGVLSYTRNQSRNFKVFVVYRAEIIRQNFCDFQRFYINTKTNPADYCSRGTDVYNTKATETQFNGPSFFWESESIRTSNRNIFNVSSNDPESKKEPQTTQKYLFTYFTNWKRKYQHGIE